MEWVFLIVGKHGLYSYGLDKYPNEDLWEILKRKCSKKGILFLKMEPSTVK